VTLNTISFGSDISGTHSYSVSIAANRYTKFEVPSFTNYKNMIGAKCKKTGHVTLEIWLVPTKI